MKIKEIMKDWEKRGELILKIIEELNSCPTGQNWGVLVWEDGSVSSMLVSGYGGEQDGDNPVIIFKRDGFGDEDLDDTDADLFDWFEEEINEAIKEREKEEGVITWR